MPSLRPYLSMMMMMMMMMSSYWSSVVTMAVSCTVFQIKRHIGRKMASFRPLPFNLHDHLFLQVLMLGLLDGAKSSWGATTLEQWGNRLTGGPWTNYVKSPIPYFEFTEQFIIIKVDVHKKISCRWLTPNT